MWRHDKKNKFCEFGTLKKAEHSYHTNNKISIEYPNRFTSLLKPKRDLKENCILIETKIFSEIEEKFGDLNILSGSLEIKSVQYFCSSIKELFSMLVW